MIEFYLLMPSDLQRRIQENPLSIIAFEEIITSCPVRFCNHKNSLINYSREELSNTIIEIGLLQTQDEQEVGLVHEVVHCVYNAASWSIIDLDEKTRVINNSVEDLIEQEAQRFYKANKDFVHNTYCRLVEQDKKQ